jgi:transcriptional regulator with XRE-family HTH domain
VQEVEEMGAKEAFANRLKLLREENGLSQTQLADKLGISRGSISFYENGDRTPDIEVLSKVQKFFNVTFDYLLGSSNCRENEYEDISKKFCLSERAINNLERFPRLASKDYGVLVSDMLNALLTNDGIIELMRKSLNFVLMINDKSILNDINKAIKTSNDKTSNDKDTIELANNIAARYIAEEYAKILLDIANKGIETYYQIARTENGWYAGTKNE